MWVGDRVTLQPISYIISHPSKINGSNWKQQLKKENSTNFVNNVKILYSNYISKVRATTEEIQEGKDIRSEMGDRYGEKQSIKNTECSEKVCNI